MNVIATPGTPPCANFAISHTASGEPTIAPPP
jgi:hypothetical protein